MFSPLFLILAVAGVAILLALAGLLAWASTSRENARHANGHGADEFGGADTIAPTHRIV